MSARDHALTMGLAALLALLIWFWAEGENRDASTVPVTLSGEVGAAPDSFDVRFIESATGTMRRDLRIDLEIEGPTGALGRADTRLRRLSVDIANAEDGEVRTLDLLSELRQHDLISELGLNLRAVDPPEATFRIDEYETRTVPIDVQLSGVETDSVTIAPPEAEVTMTKENWRFAEGLGGPIVLVRLSPEEMRRLQPGVATTFRNKRAELRRELQAATIDSDADDLTVTITPTLRISSVTMSIPVKLQMLPKEQSEYDVSIPREYQPLTGVTFTGPDEVIEQIRSRSLVISAVIDLSPDDLEARLDMKRIEFDLPQGVTAAFPDLPEGERPTIPLTITPRAPNDADPS